MKMNVGNVLVLGAMALSVATGCKKEPTPAELHRDEGNKFLNASEWEKAAAEYGQSLEADPKQEKLWEKKAYAHLQLKQMEQADAAILRTLEFKTEPAKKAEVYRNLAAMYLQTSQDKAEQYFNKAIETDPQDDQSLAWLAEIYSQRGGARNAKGAAVPAMLDKALGYYDKVIAVKPELPNTYLNKRIVLAKYMEYEKLQKQASEQDAAQQAKDKAKADEAKAAAEQHQTKMDAYKQQMDEATKKFSSLQKTGKLPPP